MAEYSRLAHGTIASLGGATPIYLPYTPDFVQVWNLSASSGTIASNAVISAIWNKFLAPGDALATYASTSTTLSVESAYPLGIIPIDSSLPVLGGSIAIQGITKANPAVVTTVANHNLVTGDMIILEGLYQTTTTGMPQISGMPFVVTVTGSATFTIPWNTTGSNYTAISGAPASAAVRKINYPFLYAPGVSFISALTYGTNTTVVTTAPHNCVLGQEVAFRMPPPWGASGLNSNNNPLVPSSPVYGFVISVTNSTTLVVNINSSSFTPFTVNIPVANVPGLSFPQMVSVGDVNTGGVVISATSSLYPSPVINGVSTINGPAIAGAFVNNTRAGFIIGANLAGTVGQILYWQAYYHDYSNGYPLPPF